MSRNKITTLGVLLATACNLGLAAATSAATEKSGACVECKILATPDVAYQALRSMREESPEGCKVLSTGPCESVIEEIFDGLPIIGQATCVYKETYEPSKTVHFQMIRSDKLKAFEGDWTFEACDNGQHTMARLRSFIDTGLKVPFAKQLTQAASSNELKLQLAEVKKSAEIKQKRLATKPQGI